jgi:hypothetical protein
MANPINRVDLFVVGKDFYTGSIKRRLKDGWCDFSLLGRQQAQHLDSSAELGRIYYLNEKVSPDELNAFEEHERQKMFLAVVGSEVTRLIVGDDPRFKTMSDAISWLGREEKAPNAMVITRPPKLVSRLPVPGSM